MKSEHWSQIQESGALLGMRFMLWIYRKLGRKVFWIFLYPVIAYFYISNGTARAASKKFLSRVRHASGSVNASGLLGLSFRHFFTFGEILLDKLAAWSGEFTLKNVRIFRREELLTKVGEGTGALLIVSHLGNLEVCRALVEDDPGIKLNILVHTKHASKFNRLLNEIDKENHLNLLQVTEIGPATAIMLKQRLDNGEIVVIAGDRTPVNGGRHSSVDFLGQAANLPQGPFILAAILKCPVYLMFCVKNRSGYEIHFEHLADRIKLPRKNRNEYLQSWVQAFAGRLEYYALRYPLQWANFYDFWR